jgi:sarcosine oxidase
VDVLVIGGGVVGAAATLAVARRGMDVALLESSPLASAQGSSAGRTRIFSPAAYPDESYLDMGLRALSRWRELELASRQRLLRPTGALTTGDFAEQELPALRSAGVEAELLSSDRASRRFGVSVSEGRSILHQADAGVIYAERARNVLLALARAAGARLCEKEHVLSIDERSESLAVETRRRDWRCSTALVAAGPWSGELLSGAGIHLPLEVSCQSVVYLGMPDRDNPPVALMDFDGDEPFACWDPEHGLKAALHARGPAVTSPPTPVPVEEPAIGRVITWARRRYPNRELTRAAVEPCMYTNTPDERFILERRGRVVVGSACNGQGFQFAPETGERLARLAGSE